LAVARRAPDIGGAVLSLLERGARGDMEETPKPGDDCFARVRHHVLASHATLIDAAVAAASRAGFAHVSTLPPETGTVVEAARRYAERAAQLRPGEIVVSGGEPTVELPRSAGLGGRNQQLALLVARSLFSRGHAGVFLALGSDGSDGPTDAAGALVDEQSWDVLSRTGDPESALSRADAYPILDAAGALVRTGLTGTNVLDLHLLARA
jgi:hydroxypyruvate reductase